MARGMFYTCFVPAVWSAQSAYALVIRDINQMFGTLTHRFSLEKNSMRLRQC